MLHNSYMISRIGFIKDKQNLLKIFFSFFSFLDKKIFCTLEPKITYFYILRGQQHVHLTQQKCFLETYSATFCSPCKVGLSYIRVQLILEKQQMIRYFVHLFLGHNIQFALQFAYAPFEALMCIVQTQIVSHKENFEPLGYMNENILK